MHQINTHVVYSLDDCSFLRVTFDVKLSEMITDLRARLDRVYYRYFSVGSRYWEWFLKSRMSYPALKLKCFHVCSNRDMKGIYSFQLSFIFSSSTIRRYRTNVCEKQVLCRFTLQEALSLDYETHIYFQNLTIYNVRIDISMDIFIQLDINSWKCIKRESITTKQDEKCTSPKKSLLSCVAAFFVHQVNLCISAFF